MAIVCVVDTNVFLGALIGQHGINRKLIRYCLQKKIIPLMGNALFAEYEDVLQREPLFLKCPLTPKERESLFEAFLSVCIWTKIYYGFRPNLIDEGDNHLMELAIAGCATHIITHNGKDFKDSNLRFPHIAIQSPQAFFEQQEDILWQQ